jgi:hypothetical protein
LLCIRWVVFAKSKHMKEYKKISLIGSCQTACYAKYLKELIPDAYFVKWLCPDIFFKKKWPYMDIWAMNKDNHVTNQNEVQSYLSLVSANENIEGMKKRESTKNVDIKLSSVFEGLTKKVFLQSNHPNTWALLKCVEKICEEINVDFFNEADFKKHASIGYPFELK